MDYIKIYEVSIFTWLLRPISLAFILCQKFLSFLGNVISYSAL